MLVQKNIILILTFFMSTWIMADNADNIWKVRAYLKNMGDLEFYMTVSKKDSAELFLKSPADRDKKLFGSFRATLLRAFQKRKFENSIATIAMKDSGEINFLVMKMKVLHTQRQTPASITGEIFSENYQQKIGFLTAYKQNPNRNEMPQMRNYQNIVDSIEQQTIHNIFNPTLIRQKNWTNFIEELKNKAPIVNDDLEFMLTFYVNARNVGFSHFGLLRENTDLERTLPGRQVETQIKNDSIAYIKINTLSGSIAEIDSVFNALKPYTYYILDFRDMPGGVLKNAYKLASYLITDTIPGGVFITKKYYANENCKNSLSLSKFPIVKNTDFDNFTSILQRFAGVNIELVPQEENHLSLTRNIYILTNSRTASAGEPLIYGLQKYGHAIVVGEKTAGRVLSPQLFTVGNNFFIMIPIAEYITPDGQHIENHGVEPSVKIKSEKALEWIYRSLKIHP